MNELVKAIENLSNKTIVDYLLIVIPIIISVIAIIISLNSTNKQNKIALFEIRYAIFKDLKQILEFDKSTYSCNKVCDIIGLFDSYFGTNISKDNMNDAIIKSITKVELIGNSVLKQQFVFGENSERQNKLEKIVESFQKFVVSAAGGDINVEERNKLHKLCDEFYKQDFNELVNKIKLWTVID